MGDTSLTQPRDGRPSSIALEAGKGLFLNMKNDVATLIADCEAKCLSGEAGLDVQQTLDYYSSNLKLTVDAYMEQLNTTLLPGHFLRRLDAEMDRDARIERILLDCAVRASGGCDFRAMGRMCLVCRSWRGCIAPLLSSLPRQVNAEIAALSTFLNDTPYGQCEKAVSRAMARLSEWQLKQALIDGKPPAPNRMLPKIRACFPK